MISVPPPATCRTASLWIQFIENDDPENKTVIDHIDHIKTNNLISNLRWVSQSE
ncbi:MAG: HNH endonuclease, partial [Bacteroidales bacterium]|nr:HNH endonuclease [Bacteroidales bacterium]